MSTPHVTCTACGAALSGARFCTSCGTPAPQPVPGAGPPTGSAPVAAPPPAPLDDAPTITLAKQPSGPLPTPSVTLAKQPSSPLPTPPLTLAKQPSGPLPTPPVPPAPPTGQLPVAEQPQGVSLSKTPLADATSAEGQDHTAEPLPPLDEEPAAAAGRRRWPLVVAGVVLLAGAGAGGVFGALYLRDAGIRDALAASTAAYNPVVEQAMAAQDVAQVGLLADEARDAAEEVERAAEQIGSRDDARADAVRAQLEAEQGVLEALAGLSDIADEPLETWGATHGALRDAVEQESERRSALTADRDAAARVADGEAMLEALTTTVGATLTEEAAQESAQVLDTLAAADKTSALRTVGERASTAQGAVREAAEALDADSGRDVLDAYGEVLSALAGLSDVRPEDTSGWDDARDALTDAVGTLSDAVGPEGATVRQALQPALAAADKVVTRAAQGHARYEQELAAATAALTADREAAAAYDTGFSEGLETYGELREALGEFTDDVNPSAEQDPFQAGFILSDAVTSRQLLRDQLDDLTPPRAAADEHGAVLALIDRGISAVQGAGQAVSESQLCLEPCDFRDSAGWREYLVESEAISKAFASASTAWRKAMDAANAELESRTLPTAPDL